MVSIGNSGGVKKKKKNWSGASWAIKINKTSAVLKQHNARGCGREFIISWFVKIEVNVYGKLLWVEVLVRLA